MCKSLGAKLIFCMYKKGSMSRRTKINDVSLNHMCSKYELKKTYDTDF